MQVVEHLKQLSSEQFQVIYEGLAEQGFGPLDREVALSLRFRPEKIRKLPIAQRARRAHQLLVSSSNEESTYELFGTYLMRHCEGLIQGFLDGTGVQHEDGMLEDVDNSLPREDALEATVAKLDGEFEPAQVSMYLAMAASQWPTLEALDRLWRSRLQTANAGS